MTIEMMKVMTIKMEIVRVESREIKMTATEIIAIKIEENHFL